ncbi:hypothetical protein NQZ68_018796 [Dissostichus eleginoides]|nr:hypothetical protein NQZ68_018796 [Dissostichus eleginoides]
MTVCNVRRYLGINCLENIGRVQPPVTDRVRRNKPTAGVILCFVQDLKLQVEQRMEQRCSDPLLMFLFSFCFPASSSEKKCVFFCVLSQTLTASSDLDIVAAVVSLLYF